MITKKETCPNCGGAGYTYYGGGMSGGFDYDSPSDNGCDTCGGSGQNEYENVRSPNKNLKKGSGKVKVTYEEIICTKCNGDKKVRYYKDNYRNNMSLFGDVSDKEKKAWEKKYTVVKTCQECNGSGKELKQVSSEPASSGWF